MTKTPETTTAERTTPARGLVFRDNLARAEHRQTTYVITAPPGAKPSDLQNPKVFGALSARFRRWDTIEVHANEGDWYAVVRVERASPSEVDLLFMGPGLGVSEIKPEFTANVGDDPDYATSYAGESDRWQIVRRRDGHVMARGFATQSAAALERDRQFRGAR